MLLLEEVSTVTLLYNDVLTGTVLLFNSPLEMWKPRDHTRKCANDRYFMDAFERFARFMRNNVAGKCELRPVTHPRRVKARTMLTYQKIYISPR